MLQPDPEWTGYAVGSAEGIQVGSMLTRDGAGYQASICARRRVRG
ncbi:MAG: hypothetical protein AAFV77_04265 [Planctomycetota bacterium]